MLRPLDLGSRQSGYARVESSGGRVRVTVAVQGFSAAKGPVYALLLGGASVVLGPLQLDSRSQGGTQLSLQAGDVEGLPLSAYGVLAVGQDTAAGFVIALAGTLGRGGWVDFARAAKELRARLHPSMQAPAEPEAPVVDPPADDGAEKAPPEDAAPDDAVDEGPIEESSPEGPAEDAPAPETPPSSEGEAATPAEDAETPPTQEEADPLAALEQYAQTLAEPEAVFPLPERLERAFWPQSFWPLHDLFQRFPTQSVLDAPDVLFIRVPLENEAADHFLLGVRMEGSWVTAAGWALPAGDGTAPKGFENAERLATADGRVYYCLWETE